MSTYPKIETLFNRKENFSVDETSLRREEFGLISQWLVTEKIDGTNIRLCFVGEPSDQGLEATVKGKTDNASIHPDLLARLTALVEKIRPEVGLIMQEHSLEEFTLYGEGYGPKVQSGGWYSSTNNFILFDVRAGHAWLSDEGVSGTAQRLGLDRVPLLVPPLLDGSVPMDRLWWTLEEIVHDVRIGLVSKTAVVEPYREMEGVVARPPVPLYDRRGERIIFKLKTKDFRAGKR